MLQPSLQVDNQQINVFKNKHKFMVQTTFAPDGEVNQESLWKKVDPSAIMESKLKCVFDLEYMNEPDNSDNKDTNYVSLTNTAKPIQNNDDTGFANSEQSSGTNNQFKNSEDNSAGLSDENRKLREEIALLRQELMQAKEEGLKKRISKPQTAGPTYGDLLEKENQASEVLIFKSNTHILFFCVFVFILGYIFSNIFN